MRYQHQRKVRYNNNKGFNDDESPLIVKKDFNNQYKRNMDLTNEDYKINIDPNDFHKLNEIGLERAYIAPDYLYKDNDTLYNLLGLRRI